MPLNHTMHITQEYTTLGDRPGERDILVGLDIAGFYA
jgi:hypothetical protein